MIWLALTLTLVSHGWASLPFWRSLRRRQIPDTASFACLSVILYYDVGLLLEACGFPYDSADFESLFLAPSATFLTGILFIAAAPWLFRLGTYLVRPEPMIVPQAPVSALGHGRKTGFYLLAAVLSFTALGLGVREFLSDGALWAARSALGQTLGPLIILLYLPLHVLAFYFRQKDSRTRAGFWISLGLAALTLVATAPVGERSNLLLPVVIWILFRSSMSLGKVAVVGAGVLVAAAAMLPVFKPQYADTDKSTGVLVAETFTMDIARGGVLRKSLELSDPVGSRILPVPLQGYIYTAVYFVPHGLAPWKGNSTGQYLTDEIYSPSREDDDWCFAIGCLEELALNCGTWLVIPGLVLYGLGMGLMDRWSYRIPALVAPSRLAGLWVCAYSATAVMLLFGTMSLMGVVLHHLFVDPVQSAELECEPDPNLEDRAVAPSHLRTV